MSDERKKGERRGSGQRPTNEPAPAEEREETAAEQGEMSAASGTATPRRARGAAAPVAKRAASRAGSAESVESADTTEAQRAPEPPRALPPVDGAALARLLAGQHHDPHGILGAHPASVGGVAGVVVRAMHPEAVSAELLLPDGDPLPMERVTGGVFAAFVAGGSSPLRYRVRFRFPNDAVWERDDPYRFPPTLGDIDLHLFSEGTHRKLWEKLGAHPRALDGVQGVAFAVWAPNAQRVSVVGDFNGWDGRIYPMRLMGSAGVWEIFIPEIAPGALYKYEILTREGVPRLKTDPFAFKMEQAPATSSIVVDLESYRWSDDAWMARRPDRDLAREPVLIYEAHLGSWARQMEEDNRSLGYRELAHALVDHVKALGFTHIELLPITEHPFQGSWGYQVSGYYAPMSRLGPPEDFKYFVDRCHQEGIGVILDWVPAHFPKDDYALRRFDGTALYEHEDPRLGEHPDWGTLIFNYGRNEVRNFLIANALFWLDEYHLDGLRVDAVASMLYLDYSRKAGQWLRNRYGGRENLEAIDFLKQMNETVHAEQPGCVTIAEESTAWPGVTRPPSEGGLGFNFKWNMGWMHDTLQYFSKDPVYRRHHHDQLTFAMMYEYSERFIMPLSHDEVVHLKRSLLEKMPGDDWQKFANLRLLLAYQYTRPGKKLLFMGTELAPRTEWNHDSSLDWHLSHARGHGGFQYFVQQLGALYRARAPFWRHDADPHGFAWIDVADRENSIVSYVRRDGEKHVIVVLNMTPVPREHYRIGAPEAGDYVELLSTDDERFGGSGYDTPKRLTTEPSPFHGYPQSLALRLPPLGAVILAPADER